MLICMLDASCVCILILHFSQCKFSIQLSMHLLMLPLGKLSIFLLNSFTFRIHFLIFSVLCLCTSNGLLLANNFTCGGSCSSAFLFTSLCYFIIFSFCFLSLKYYSFLFAQHSLQNKTAFTTMTSLSSLNLLQQLQNL